MLRFTIRQLRRLALPALALSLACTDDPQPVAVVDLTPPTACVADTLQAPVYTGACLEAYFHTAGVLNTNGYTYDVTASGGTAYVCDGPGGLALMDIHDPSRPSFASVLSVPGEPRDAAVCGDLVFVASGNRGLVVVDASDPTHPAVLSDFDTPGEALGVAYRDGRVYLADDVIGLEVLDVSDPMRPRGLGVENTPGRANGLAIVGPRAYLSDGLLGLRIVSVADPSNPWLVASVPVVGQPAAVDVENDVAYVAAGTEGIVVIDVTRPDSAQTLTTFDTPGVALDVAVDNGVLFVADGSNGLLVLDVTVPGAPEIVARSGAEGVSRGVATMGSWAFTADSDGGFRVMNAANVVSPPIASTFDASAHEIQSIATSNDGYAYAGVEGSFVFVIGRNAYNRLEREGYVYVSGAITQMTYYEGHIYVANGGAITIIDPSTPSEPKVVSGVPITNAEHFAIVDSTMFITRGFVNNAAILDMRTGVSIGLTFSAGSVAADASNGFFAQLTGRVWVTVGKVGPGQPVRNVLEGAGSTRDVAIRGNHLFVAKHQGGTDGNGVARSAGVEVFEVLTAQFINPLTYIETSVAVERIAFDGDLMYVAGGDQGLEVVDVSDVLAPSIVGTFATTREVVDVKTLGSEVLVSAGTEGLLLLGVTCP